MNQEEQRPKVVQNSFSEEFLANLVDVSKISVHLYTRAYILIALIAGLLLVGLGSRPVLWSGIGALAVLVSQYFRLKGLSAWLTIERRISRPVIKKGERLTVKYKIQNRSSQSHPPFLILDSTQYLRSKFSAVGIPRNIEAGGTVEVSAERICEAPSGKLRFAPFSIQVMDELGLFRVQRFFEDKLEVQIIQTETGVDQELLLAERSPLAGDVETSRPGQGISLHGLREYRDGDPLNSIYWKKSSMDEHGFSVKEFELDITRRVAFLLVAEPRLHLGYGASSTWEIAKAYTLGKIRHYLEAQSSVSLISRSIQLQDVGGMQNLPLFERALSYDFIQLAANNSELSVDELGAYALRLTPPCLVYFITPYVSGNEEKWLKQIDFLKSEGFQPTVVFINTSASAGMLRRRFGSAWTFHADLGNVEESCIHYRSLGIDAFWIGAKDLNGRIGVKKYG